MRHTPYSILDDETFVTMEEEEAMYVPNMNVGCGLISHVSEPMHVKKSGKMFGFWGRDVGPDRKSHGSPIWDPGIPNPGFCKYNQIKNLPNNLSF